MSHDVYTLPPDLPVPVDDRAADHPRRNRQVIADPQRLLGAALGLPTFEIAGVTLYKRITLVSEDARIEKVSYPVFPPDGNANDVLRWLLNR